MNLIRLLIVSSAMFMAGLCAAPPSAHATQGVDFRRSDHLLHFSVAYGLGLTTMRALTTSGLVPSAREFSRRQRGHRFFLSQGKDGHLL